MKTKIITFTIIIAMIIGSFGAVGYQTDKIQEPIGEDYTEYTVYGIGYSEKQGDVKPSGEHAVHLSEGSEKAIVFYDFVVWTKEVVQIGLEYREKGTFGDGPTVYLKNYDNDKYERIGPQDWGVTGSTPEWKWKSVSNPTQYVEEGHIQMKVVAEEDGFLNGDEIILDEVGIRYISCKPDLYITTDRVNFTNTPAGDLCEFTFDVENRGDDNSELNWEVTKRPNWGAFAITPTSGTDLKKGSKKTVEVSFFAPAEKKSGEIYVVNKDDSRDYEIIDIFVTPRFRSRSAFLNILEVLRARFPILGMLV